MNQYDYQTDVVPLLKSTREQQEVVGPLVDVLVRKGWQLDQIVFGKKEWMTPKTPSEATKREKGQSFQGFPVDITVFASPLHRGDPKQIVFIVECKNEDETAGLRQLEVYFSNEPHAKLGVLANSADESAFGTYLYRLGNGSQVQKRYPLQRLPGPSDPVSPDHQATCYADLLMPSEKEFRKRISDLLDHVVTNDQMVTRREEQLDQLCNILLTKLESDKQGKSDPNNPVPFRPHQSESTTAEEVRKQFGRLVDLYPETFITVKDKELRLSDDTIAECVKQLSGLGLIDMGVSSVSVAFQVLRSEALKQGEGQYFTPQAVIEAGVRLVQIKQTDLIIDPACGTGGFLVQSMLEMRRLLPMMSDASLSGWAQRHLYGIEKDAIGLKLTKAIMSIAGDGSAHCARGDSVVTHRWQTDYPHLSPLFADGRFSVVLTNPPFGKGLKVAARDSRLSCLNIAQKDDGTYRDLEIGLLFLQRAYQLLKKGGRVGIVLPETYFFSSNYQFVLDWIKPRLRPIVVANIPMDAFQGFCRAKTNFYVFEKVSSKP